jgi:hypothetical protein
MEIEKQYEQGKLYQFTGTEFLELKPSGETKIPVSSEAMEAVKQMRIASQHLIKLRPELSLTASAMLLAAADLPNMAELIQKYGQRIYSGIGNSVAPVDTAEQGDSSNAGVLLST